MVAACLRMAAVSYGFARWISFITDISGRPPIKAVLASKNSLKCGVEE